MRREFALAWYGLWLKEEGMRAATIRTRLSSATIFTRWLACQHIDDLTTIDRCVMESYARNLVEVISTRTGKPYKPHTRSNLWAQAVGLLTALYDAGHLSALPIPRGVLKTPHEYLPTVLSEADIDGILELIDTSTHGGRTDRALYELIYAAGLRVSEAVSLKWDDVNIPERLAYIRQAKFDKDRIVPLTHEAVEMLARYRSTLETTTGFVFTGRFGGHVGSSHVNRRFKDLARTAGVYRPGVTVHQLRHACATHMIAHGADIRYVQELLGHVSIQTTVRYTHDQVEQVKRMYRSHHPRENQLYEEVGDEYRQRIEALKQNILRGRQKNLARKASQG